MLLLLLRRLLGRLTLIAVAVVLAYVLAASALHPRAALEGRSPRPPQAEIEARLDELNVNDRTPLDDRCLTWVAGLAHGDLGRTLDGVPVAAELWRRAAVSLRLLLAGTVLGTGLGVLAGAYGAVRRHGIADRLLTLGAFAVLSVPVFVLAVLLQTAAQWVNDRTGVRILAWTGEYTPGEPGGALHLLADRLRHLALPTVTIALGQAAICARYQRAAMLGVLDTGYVRTALAKGLRRRQALTRHALPMALAPTVTLAAYALAALPAGAVPAEQIFGWHGMGEWLVDAIRRDDVNAVAAYGCFAAVLVFAAGALSDLARAALDPRTRGRA